MGFKRSRHNPRNVVTSYASTKMQGPVGANSTIEGDLGPLMDFERWVKQFQSEPWTIEASFHDGSSHDYTMDYWIETDDAFVIVECKPFDRKDDDHTRQQIAIGSAYAAENGGLFLFVIERDLRYGHYLNNVQVLRRYSRLKVPPLIAQQCIAFVAAHPCGAYLRDVVTHVAEGQHPATHVGFVYNLLFHHLLYADLYAEPIGYDSLIFLPEHRLAEATADLTARHFGGPLRIGLRGLDDTAADEPGMSA